MNIVKGMYQKKNGETRRVELFAIKNDSKSFEGIDLTILNEKEREEFMEVAKAFDEILTKNMKAYRKILMENLEAE